MHSQLSISDSDLWCSELTGFTMQSTGILGLLNNSRMLNILDKRSHFSDSTTGFQDHHTAGRHIQNLRSAELSYTHLYPADKNWFILDSAFTKSSLKTQMKICDPVLLFRKLLLNEIIIIKKRLICLMLSHGLKQHKENQPRKVLMNLSKQVLPLVISSFHYKIQELLLQT